MSNNHGYYRYHGFHKKLYPLPTDTVPMAVQVWCAKGQPTIYPFWVGAHLLQQPFHCGIFRSYIFPEFYYI